MRKSAANLLDRINHILCRVDGLPLWWVGLLLTAIVLSPNLGLGEGSVFTVHDQLDESMMNYVLTARHPGEGVIPEMLGGVNASGLAPSAVLFVLLYRCLPPFTAFLCTYGILVAGGFLGMYLSVRELTDSSILAVAAAGVFCMLPLYPVYGFSQMGIPLILYAFLCFYREKHIPAALGLTLLFGLTSHLVYTGYVVLGLWLLAVCVMGLRKEVRKCRLCGAGFGLLLVTYLLTNLSLFAEILFGASLNGGISYVSHREEMVNSALPFGRTVWEVFTSSAQHAFTYHERLIVPIVVLLVLGGIFYKKLDAKDKRRYRLALGGMLALVLIAVFYGICKSAPVVAWKNSVTGFLHYFQIERVYWLYPAGWYLELALVFSFWWRAGGAAAAETKAVTDSTGHGLETGAVMPRASAGGRGDGLEYRKWRLAPLLQCIVLAAVLLPTADTVLHNSYFYMNVNQRNNGSGVTGYISWESYYAEELMEQLEEAIGRELSEYRVAHLGISPAPALMHGFYTVDGYSNNYPLDYKHAFRRVIAAELEKSPETAVYFDKWGNRCYLFNSQTGNYWLLKKGSGVVYEGLEFDMEALRGLGCEYLFSGGEIADAEQMGLELMGYFETEDSYWGIRLYRLTLA
ncbi:MAG: DUF6044 family protein [Muribaculum sp.]|nr:DUF6044 family protein [Muribaculum sp.]